MCLFVAPVLIPSESGKDSNNEAVYRASLGWVLIPSESGKDSNKYISKDLETVDKS